MRPRRTTRVLLLFVLAALGCERIEATRDPQASAEPTRAARRPPHDWPPRVGEPYPDLSLLKPDGERVLLSSLRGRVLMVEPVGLDCPACNAFAGANRPGVGGFQGTPTREDLPSVTEMLRHYGVDPADPRLVHVQLLLFDLTRTKAPSVEMARLWSEHFGFGFRPNELVLVGEDYLIGRDSYEMIPGFQLIDVEFHLRWDSSGYDPVHDLWRELLPALPGMLAEVDADPEPGG